MITDIKEIYFARKRTSCLFYAPSALSDRTSPLPVASVNTRGRVLDINELRVSTGHDLEMILFFN